MALVKQVEDWKSSILMVLDSKVEELILMDYDNATREIVWNCLVEKVWKGNPEKRLFQIVEDILHLSASKYMSYLTMQSYQNEDLMASITAISEMNEVK
ncbi:post-transcriptional regulator [Paraliobacillus sediminis]|uniref:post-transcriptional regulator n=1 Tax=Paraliobacillus sediminis TaxID=1885916 RepID=UPI000E3D4CC7|nr:post-transcriptional regulator [Paraliobacillus sediminis]